MAFIEPVRLQSRADDAQLIDGVSDQEVRSLFTAARDEDYEAIAKEARALAEAPRQDLNAMTQVEGRGQLTRLKAKLAQVVAIDFFGANGRETVDGLLTGLETKLTEGTAVETSESGAAHQTAALAHLKDHTWVTRQGVHVDRIACAWLIRRFIDPGARFKFVSGKGYAPSFGELRFAHPSRLFRRALILRLQSQACGGRHRAPVERAEVSVASAESASVFVGVSQRCMGTGFLHQQNPNVARIGNGTE